MRKILPFILMIALAGMTAYAASYFCCTAPVRALQAEKAPELAWLRREFSLDDAAFEKISAMHRRYLPQCEEICARISAKNAEIRGALSKAGAVTPEIGQKIAEAAALRAQCQSNMLGHFLAVSRTMPPEQGRRYLEWVEGVALGPMGGMMPESCPACKK